MDLAAQLTLLLHYITAFQPVMKITVMMTVMQVHYSSEGDADSDVRRIGQVEGGEASDTVGSGDESTAVQEEMHAALRSGDLGCVVCLKEE